MTQTTTKDAIAILIDLAQQGEIDPWDVQVIKVIDRFISELGLMDENISSATQADLPRSGQAFLWASMLVLFKADTLDLLDRQEIEEEMEFLDLEDSSSETLRSFFPTHLERHIRRRVSAPPPTRRKVTLKELIEQLEHIAAEIEAVPVSLTRSTNVSPTRSRRETVSAIAQLAHDENLTEVAALLENFLISYLPQLLPGQDCVELEQLLEWWTRANISNHASHEAKEHGTNSDESIAHHSKIGDKVGIFWGLLLLSAQSKVELSQQEFYQDLTIRPLIDLAQTES